MSSGKRARWTLDPIEWGELFSDYADELFSPTDVDLDNLPF